MFPAQALAPPGTLPSQATPTRDPHGDKFLTPTCGLRGRGQ